ncbi:alpha/beta hydrolase [Christensenellaceae bacterium OttesenSCG-928-L17]|nr:alpha/beta hydrolase [Christensenellaceae bacterium OttesenSCG-928-L17]
MPKEEMRFPSATGLTEIYAEVWEPVNETPWAVLQLAHGMAEHIARYAPFAEYLNQAGIAVVMHDHCSHGKSTKDGLQTGYFGEKDGDEAVLLDMRALNQLAHERYPDLPLVLMGHSMGSFFSRVYITRYPGDAQVLILSGTGGKNPAASAGMLVAKLERRRNGAMQPSKLLNDLSFGSFNKQFEPARTEFDWLSTDPAEVDKYIADPLCGFVFTAEAMRDLLKLMGEVSSEEWAQKVPRIPIYVFSGAKDPVGGNGKGVRQVVKWLEDAGHTVSCKLYEEGRHEMLNERNKDQVMEDILHFIKTTDTKRSE